MPYWRLFYHIVWSTKNREPLLKATWEQDLYGYIWGKSTALSCEPHAINGMDDHIHVAISIPPRHSISTFVGQLKGSSSRYINQVLEPSGTFAWQSGYGVLSLSEESLPRVVQYIQFQKEHHNKGQMYQRLESTATES
ncbi:MAG: IS200/IS605 family transposase [Anaerolineales bacterium]